MNEVCIYLIVINLLAFLLYGLDKRRARRQQWRISEKTLLAVAAAGGAPGAWGAMYLFRHKTRHKRFVFLVPLFLVMQVFLIIFVYYPDVLGI